MSTLTAERAAATGRPPEPAGAAHELTGTLTLVRLALRRDRILLPVWVLVLAGVAASGAAATVELYPTEASRRAAAEAANSTPAVVALYGRIYDPNSLGGIGLLKMSGFGAVLVAILMAVLVIRHTRTEEETGRMELMLAGVLGRRAPLAAALTVGWVASVSVGVATALGLVAAGLGATGSWAFGLAWACAGIAFASVAAVAAQLTASARAATGISMAVVGAAYLLRAAGDTRPPDGARWLSWLSPIGWSQQLRAFGGERWWVVLLPITFALLLAVAAVALLRRRDFGAGLVQPRPGPAVAASSLRSPLALAVRLQRGTFVAWAAAYAVLALLVGGLASSVSKFLDSPQARELMTRLGGVQGLTDAFLSTEVGMAAVIASAYGIQAVLRLHAEETALHAEPLLATAVTRTRWMASHVLVAVGGAAALMLVMGVCLGLSRGVSVGDVPGQLGVMLGAALARLPAVWVVVGIAVMVFGAVPQATQAAWIALVGFLVIGEFGPLLKLSQLAMDLSPYTHVPDLPGGSVTWTSLVVLLALAAALVAGGLAAFRRRDVG